MEDCGAQQLHRNRTLLGGWSSRWRWQARLEAYLRHREEERFRQAERDIQECNQRHLDIAQALRSKATERLQQLDTSRLPADSAIKMFALAIQTERQVYGLDKPPVAHTSRKSTLTEVSLSETQEIPNCIQEKLRKLSPVSRDIMRQLTSKTLRILQFESETFEEGDSDRGNIAPSPTQPTQDGASKEANPSEEAGTQQGD